VSLDVCGIEEEMMSYREFKSLRNKVQSWICTAKSNYYLAIFNQSDNPVILGNISVIWNLLRKKTE